MEQAQWFWNYTVWLKYTDVIIGNQGKQQESSVEWEVRVELYDLGLESEVSVWTWDFSPGSVHWKCLEAMTPRQQWAHHFLISKHHSPRKRTLEKWLIRAGEVPDEPRASLEADKQGSAQRMMRKCPQDPGPSTKGLLVCKSETIWASKVITMVLDDSTLDF